MKDLEGKTVSVDLPNGGTFITATNVFERLGIKPKFAYIEQRISMEKLKAGEIDAVICAGGKPYKSVSQFKDDRFHLVPVEYAKPLQGDYLPATLTAKDYPNLIAEGAQVDTIAVPAVLADPLVLVADEGVVAYARGGAQPFESAGWGLAAVVAAGPDHARAGPNQSLAVVGLTGAIVDGVRARLLEAVAELADDDAAMAFLAGSGDEPFVVTSFERAAGLERDVVILAMGYGRTPHGRVLHRFPSVDAPAAASALAAVRRAPRHRLVVVTALSSSEIVSSRLKSPGARALRDLLVAVEAATGADAGATAEVPAVCLLYTSPSPRDRTRSRMPSSA